MKILLADDHALFRDGLRYVLQQLAERVEILEAPDFQVAMQLASKHPELDMALLDLHMPGSTGPKSVAYFHRRFPHIPVVVVSAEEDSVNIEKVMNSGATGFVCKSSSAQTMLNALKLVLAGGVYVPPEILRHANSELMHDDKRNHQVANSHGLTPRQLEVLRHLCAGMSNKEIASTINLAEGTVKIHVAAANQALNVNSRVEAVIVAEQLGLIGVTHG
ncbi:MAG: response regulator transcription factor [Gallionella sp.]|nr:response regulator transcription factor [Gallionella sp.]MDD4946287.1 response regulator transcription factor [Gallionella sp.]MDD5612471.1 response regulator transcription factor [Gallionella sp.]